MSDTYSTTDIMTMYGVSRAYATTWAAQRRIDRLGDGLTSGYIWSIEDMAEFGQFLKTRRNQR